VGVFDAGAARGPVDLWSHGRPLTVGATGQRGPDPTGSTTYATAARFDSRFQSPEPEAGSGCGTPPTACRNGSRHVGHPQICQGSRKGRVGMLSSLRAAIVIVAVFAGACSGPDQDECSAPSSCGDRQYCDDAKTSICIRSAEGVNRCGKIPSSCHVQLCQQSADCATLGSDYFCDTPNSGCCSDPPQELPRCVAAFHDDGGRGGR
jgi:hypothetical protein